MKHIIQFRSPLIKIGLIFLLALSLRLLRLDQIPFGLHEDEMMNGYVGRFILLNGKDLYGNSWPLLYFNNFGDYPNVIPMYLSGIFTFLFGNSAFAIRFPIAVAGAFAVIPMYLLSKKIFVNDFVATGNAFLLAILPWHLILSRATAENITATTVYLIGLTGLVYLIERPTIRLAAFMILSLAGTYVLYPSYRILIPITVGLSIFFCNDRKLRSTLIALTLLFFTLTAAISSTTWGKGRFAQTSIFSFNNTVAGRLLSFSNEEGPNNVFTARLFHNKYVGYSREFIRQYLGYWAFPFLFMDGGLPHRYILKDSGLLYLSMLAVVVAVIGFAVMDPKKQDNVFHPTGRTTFLYICLLLGFSLIPAALTLDDVPNIHRAVLFPVLLLIPMGFAVSQLVNRRLFHIPVLLPVFCLLCIEFIYFAHMLFVHMPASQAAFRGDDRTTLARYLIENKAKYDKIFVPQDAKPLYYLFFSNNFDDSLAGRFTENIRLEAVDNIVFTQSNCPSEGQIPNMTKKSLLVDRAECQHPGLLEGIATIPRVDSTGSFRIYRLSPLATGSASAIESR